MTKSLANVRSYNLVIRDQNFQKINPSLGQFIIGRDLTKEFVTGTSLTVGPQNLGTFTPEHGDPLANFVSGTT